MNERARQLLALVLTLGTAAVAPAQSGQTPAAEDLLETAESSVWPHVFTADVSLRTTENGETVSEMRLEVLHSREMGTYMEITEPARSRGLRFLQVEERLWMYNPRSGSNRAIRLSPRAAFQGSVFSNRDLSDPQFTDDYEVSVSGTETITHEELGEVPCYVLEAEARDESVAYARIRLWIRRSDSLLLRGEYYAKSGLLFKRAEFLGIRQLAGRQRPTEIRMVSQQAHGTAGTMVIHALETHDALPARQFSQTYLTR